MKKYFAGLIAVLLILCLCVGCEKKVSIEISKNGDVKIEKASDGKSSGSGKSAIGSTGKNTSKDDKSSEDDSAGVGRIRNGSSETASEAETEVAGPEREEFTWKGCRMYICYMLDPVEGNIGGIDYQVQGKGVRVTVVSVEGLLTMEDIREYNDFQLKTPDGTLYEPVSTNWVLYGTDSVSLDALDSAQLKGMGPNYDIPEDISLADCTLVVATDDGEKEFSLTDIPTEEQEEIPDPILPGEAGNEAEEAEEAAGSGSGGGGGEVGTVKMNSVALSLGKDTSGLCFRPLDPGVGMIINNTLMDDLSMASAPDDVIIAEFELDVENSGSAEIEVDVLCDGKDLFKDVRVETLESGTVSMTVIIRTDGTVSAGDYTVELHIDGSLVGSDSITVK